MSALNCKPGDLAIVVIGDHAGAVLTCIRSELRELVMPDRSIQMMDVWLTDRDFCGCFGVVDRYIEDELLRPIRDPGEDARDETLSWKRVPSSSTTKDAEVSNG